MQEKYIMSEYHKNEVYALLNDKGIPYKAVEHEAVFTMETWNVPGSCSWLHLQKPLSARRKGPAALSRDRP